jgi:hypothetical protein
MKYLPILLLSACATIEPGPQPDGSIMVSIPKETVEQCEREGGCSLVSQEYINQYAQEFATYQCGKRI